MTKTLTNRTKGELTYVFVIVCTLLLRVATSEGLYEKIGINQDVFFTCIVQIVCFGGLPFVCWRLFQLSRKNYTIGTLFCEFNLKKPSLRNLLRTVFIGVSMIYLATIISVAWNIVLKKIGFFYVSSSSPILTVEELIYELLLTALLPGIFEEFTHRGLLFACYRDSGWKVVLISAIFFSLMHQNIRQTGYTFFDGLVLALLVYYSGSILPAIVVHFLNNAISVLWNYGDSTGNWLSFIGKASDWLYGSSMGYLVGALLAFVALATMVFLFYRMRKDAVEEGRLSGIPFSSENVLARPIMKSAIFWIIIVAGVATTTFSFIWGLMK